MSTYSKTADTIDNESSDAICLAIFSDLNSIYQWTTIYTRSVVREYGDLIKRICGG